MNLLQARTEIVIPALRYLPEAMSTPKAEVILLAIGLQESRFEHRKQVGGPAKGFWQFEQNGGVQGVLMHPNTRWFAEDICKKRNVPAMAKDVYDRLEHDDILAACFARLLLWTDNRSIPAIGQVEKAWECYIRNWRPGQPHRHSWNILYLQAMDCIKELIETE